MDKKHIISLLPDYLDDVLNDTQKRQVEVHLKKCESCLKEMKALKELFKAFDNEKEFTPSANLKINFLEQLELEKKKSTKVVSLNDSSIGKLNNWASNLFKVAASLTLLFGVYFFGKQQQSQIANAEITKLTDERLAFQQTAMLSLMENKSASRRIQGVNYIEEFKELDEAIVKALADRMLYDENTNVRAAAVEVLANYTNSEKVKETFIKALKTENEPGIQIIIIKTLGIIQEKKAAKPMRDLLDKEDTPPFVKEQIESVLTTII